MTEENNEDKSNATHKSDFISPVLFSSWLNILYTIYIIRNHSGPFLFFSFCFELWVTWIWYDFYTRFQKNYECVLLVFISKWFEVKIFAVDVRLVLCYGAYLVIVGVRFWWLLSLLDQAYSENRWSSLVPM